MAEQAPKRMAVAVAGNRCVALGGEGVLDRIGQDLKGAVGKPNRLALLLEEGTDPDLATEVRHLLIDASFKVSEVAVPRGPEALGLDGFSALSRDLAAIALTADDALCAVGGAEALSLASFAAGRWCGGIAAMGIATTLEALVRCPGTPSGLTVAGERELLRATPALSFVYADPVLADYAAADAAGLMARALIVQTAVANTKASYEALMKAMDGLAAADAAAFLDQGLESARDRGRVVSSTVAVTRKSLGYGRKLADGLAACLGDGVPRGLLLAEGMRFAARLGWQLSGLDQTFVFDQDAIFEALGLGLVPCDLEPEHLLDAMKAASARRTNRWQFMLPAAPGMVRPNTVADDVLLQHLKGFCDSRRRLLERTESMQPPEREGNPNG